MDENEFMTSIIEEMTDEEFEVYCEALGKIAESYSGKENDHE
jgi:hypothetical protein